VTVLNASRLTTDAIVALLVSAALKIGDGEIPAGGGWQGTPGLSVFNGYGIVFPVAGGSSDGSVGQPDSDADLIYQVSTWGGTRAAADAVLDKANAVLLAWPLYIPGRVVQSVRVDTYGGTRREDTGEPALYMAFNRYRVYTTPN
jgi:hypothetical protein